MNRLIVLLSVVSGILSSPLSGSGYWSGSEIDDSGFSGSGSYRAASGSGFESGPEFDDSGFSGSGSYRAGGGFGFLG